MSQDDHTGADPVKVGTVECDVDHKYLWREETIDRNADASLFHQDCVRGGFNFQPRYTKKQRGNSLEIILKRQASFSGIAGFTTDRKILGLVVVTG